MPEQDASPASPSPCPACGMERTDGEEDCPHCGEPAQADRGVPETIFMVEATKTPPPPTQEAPPGDGIPPTHAEAPAAVPDTLPSTEGEGRDLPDLDVPENERDELSVPETFFHHDASSAPVSPKANASPPALPAPGLGNTDDTVQQKPQGGSSAAPPAEGSPKLKQIGRYGILRTIGRGGMGEVYLARHPELGNEVALKVLHSAGHAGSEELERFRIEAQTAATLVHPHIVRTYDFGEVDGVHYLTQEFVVGTSLDALIREHPPSPRRSMEILADLAEAVHYAHVNHIIHRDLKPANVLLDRNGEPKLADFGLARRVGASQLTRTGTVMGTPSYMAPEQAEGETDKIDARSDVYGLGAILYEMLTSKPPFQGINPMEVIYKVIRQDPAPPQALDRRISPDISAICLKCMEKRPADRYASALELSEDCRRYLDGEPVLAKPAGIFKRTWRKVRRHRTLVLSLLAVGLIGLGAAAAVYYRYAVYPEQEARARQKQLDRERGLRELEARKGLEQIRGLLAEGCFEKAYKTSEEVLTRFAAYAKVEAIPVTELRRAGAMALLGRARKDLQADRIEDGKSAIRRLLERYEGLNDPELPLADAHLLLAEVARRKKRTESMRQELFHAYSASAGTSRENRLLARIGHLFYKAREVDLARRIFLRVERTATDPRAVFDARLGAAKCTASNMEFDKARSLFHEILKEGAPSDSQAEENAVWKDLLKLLSGKTQLPVGLYSMAARDLDGDGKPELVLRHGKKIVVGRLENREWKELAALEPFKTTGRRPHRLRAVDAFDLDGDGQREILVAGGGGRRGSLFVMAWNKDRLSVTAVEDLPTSVTEHPFCMADFDGDGKQELVVAEQWSGRALRIYRYGAKEPRLRLLHRLPLRCDMDGAFAGDWDQDGRDEIWGLAGPWGKKGNSLLRLEYEPATGSFASSPEFFTSFYHLDRSYRPGEKEIMIGAGWWEAAFIQQLVRLGPDKFREGRRMAGAYVLKMTGKTVEATLLDHLTWRQVEGRHFCHPRAVRLRAPHRDFVWTWVQHWAKVGKEEPYRIRVFTRSKKGWPFLAEFQTFDKGYTTAQAWDVDGDGDDELIVNSTIYGLEGASCGPQAALAPPPEQAGKVPPPSQASLALRKAREAYSFGIVEEALALYGEVLKTPHSLEDLDEAAEGRIQCLLSRNRHQDAAGEALALVGQYSRLLGRIGPKVVTVLSEKGHWTLAAPLARRMLGQLRLSFKRRQLCKEIVRRAEELEKLTPAVTLSTLLADPEVDLLASTPVVIQPAGPDSIDLYVQGLRDGDFLAVPLTRTKSILRLKASWTVTRHDWNNAWEFGFYSGEAWGYGSARPKHWSVTPPDKGFESVHLSLAGVAAGNGAFPALLFCLNKGRSHEILATTLARNRVVSATLTLTPAGRQLRCDLNHPDTGATTHTLHDAGLGEQGGIYLYLRGGATESSQRSRSRFRFDTFTLEGDPSLVRPAPFEPKNAADYLFRANGEALRGRLGLAASLYDKAIVLGDEEAQSVQDGAVFLPPVDARFWRAILGARRGEDPEPALEMLLAARKLSEERVLALIDRCALPLDGKEGERKLLLAYFQAVHQEQTKGSPAFLDWIKKNASLAALQLIFPAMGLRLAYNLDVVRLEEAFQHKPADGPLEPGDILVQYNGSALENPHVFMLLQNEARKAQSAVSVQILRKGAPQTVTLDPTRLWIVAKLRLSVEKEK